MKLFSVALRPLSNSGSVQTSRLPLTFGARR